MGNGSSSTVGGGNGVRRPTADTNAMAATTVVNGPHYWRQSYNKVLPDNLPRMHQSAFLQNGPRFTQEHNEPRMRGRPWSPYTSPMMTSACVSRMDKENYGAFFDANSAGSTLYKMPPRFHSRMPSVTASRMVSVLSSPMHSCMTSRATSRRSSFSRGDYIRRKKRHAPQPPTTNNQTRRAATPESFSSSNDHVRRKFRRKRHAPGPPLQRTWSEKSIDVPVQISEVRAEIHKRPPAEPVADYDSDVDRESASVTMQSPQHEKHVLESNQLEEQMPLVLAPEYGISMQNEDAVDDLDSAPEVPAKATELLLTEVVSQPKPPQPPPPPPPPPPPLPGMGAAVVTPKGSSDIQRDVAKPLEKRPSLRKVTTTRQLSSQEIFAAELQKVYKERESRLTRGTLRMKWSSKSVVYSANIRNKNMFSKTAVVANGDATKSVIANGNAVQVAPPSVDSEAWVPAHDLPEDDFDEVDVAPKHFQKIENGSHANGYIYHKNGSAKSTKKQNRYNSLRKLKNSMRTVFGSIGKGIKNRKKIDEVFEIGIDNDSGDKWEIYPSEDYDDVPDEPMKVDHVEKCAAYAYQVSTGELVLLPNYDSVLVTVDGRRIREADIAKVNQPKWSKRLPDENQRNPLVENAEQTKIDAEKERDQQSHLEQQFAEVRFLNTKFQGSGKKGLCSTVSHDELLRIVAAKIPPPSSEIEQRTSSRWSVEERNSGMLDKYFVDMNTYSLDRNNNKKKSSNKRDCKSKRHSPSKISDSVDREVNANPVYSSGADDEDEDGEEMAVKANSHESSSTKDSGYKTEHNGIDKTDQPSDISARLTASNMPDMSSNYVPQQPVMAHPPQWYTACPGGIPMTTPMPYLTNANVFNPMMPVYNPAMYNPYMQPMANGYVNPAVYPSIPALQTLLPPQTVPAPQTLLTAATMTTQNMAVSMFDSLGNNVSLASTAPSTTTLSGAANPPPLLPKPRKELINGPIGFRHVEFNPGAKVSAVTIPATAGSIEYPEVDAGNAIPTIVVCSKSPQVEADNVIPVPAIVVSSESSQIEADNVIPVPAIVVSSESSQIEADNVIPVPAIVVSSESSQIEADNVIPVPAIVVSSESPQIEADNVIPAPVESGSQVEADNEMAAMTTTNDVG